MSDHQSERVCRAVARAGEGTGRKLGRSRGLLVGPTQQVIETVLDAKMTEGLDYEKHQVTDYVNVRNGDRVETVIIQIGPIETDVP